MKKGLIALVSLIMLLAFTSVALADNPIKLIFNGQEVACDQPPVMENDRVMVPIRIVSESLGAKVNWDQDNKAVNVDMFTLKSPAFKNAGTIPEKYAEMNMVSPPLSWENAPEGTKSFALAVTDPDVPEMFQFPRVFAHWMVYNIPATTLNLQEGASPGGSLPDGAMELNSDFITSFKVPNYPSGYGAPWPPDAAHRYVFTLYALKTDTLEIDPAADYTEFVKAVLPQTIATATLIGNYGPAKNPLPGN